MVTEVEFDEEESVISCSLKLSYLSAQHSFNGKN